MLLVSHILIAFSGLIYASYLFFSPSQNKFKLAYWFLGLTIASGSMLVIFSGANILKTCFMGLAYTGFVYASIIAAKRKLAKVDRIS